MSSFNSLATKKQTTKFSSANFQKMLCANYIISLNKVARDEPLHQDLRCLRIQLFSSLILKDLSRVLAFFRDSP